LSPGLLWWPKSARGCVRVFPGLLPVIRLLGYWVIGEALYQHFVEQAGGRGLKVVTGEFGADMLVSIQSRGRATFMLEV